MSYVLHVFEAPRARDPHEAMAAVSRGIATASGPRLASFARALRAVYPDAHMLEADGRDGDDAAWTDSPLQPDGDGVFVLGLATGRLDDNLIRFVAHTAAEHGLQVVDPQAGVLYRNREAISMGGTTGPVPEPRPPEPIVRPVRAISEEEAIRTLVTLTAARQSARGFTAYLEGTEPYAWCAWRDHGDVRQAIRFTASWDRDDGIFRVGVYFHFGGDTLWGMLERHAPNWAGALEDNRRRLGPSFGTFQGHANELFADARGHLWRDTFAKLLPGDVESWGTLFNDWLDQKAMTQLDAARDLAGLSRLLHTDHRYGRIEHHHQWEASQIATSLFLLRLVDTRGIDEAKWWALLEKRAPASLEMMMGGGARAKMIGEELAAALQGLRGTRNGP